MTFLFVLAGAQVSVSSNVEPFRGGGIGGTSPD